MLQIGNYRVAALLVQEFALDGGAMFGVVPKVFWQQQAPADALNRVTLAARLLLISGAGRNMLVDVGLGDAWSDKQRSIYAISPFRLREELQRFQLTADDITDVILSHLHFDHIAGAFAVENGGLVSLFPSATFHVQERNLQVACHPHIKEKGSYLSPYIDALMQQCNDSLKQGECDLCKGVSLLVSNGHTQAQQLVKISDGKQTLLHGGDLLPSAAHLPLAWITSYDVEPLQAINEKTALLETAMDEEWLLFFGHDPRYAAARIRRGEKGAEVAEYFEEL